MSLNFRPMNNQAMVPITTVNSSTLVTLTFTITMKAISSGADIRVFQVALRGDGNLRSNFEHSNLFQS